MYLILDESGTHDCRYMVIGGMYVHSTKPIKNKVKKTSLKIKKKHPVFASEREIKSSNFLIKKQFVEGLAEIENVEFRYIVADNDWIYGRLKENQNIMINYLMGFLIRPIVRALDGTGEELKILFDNRSLKTGAKFCMEEYLKIKSYGDFKCDTRISVQFLESESNYVIQGAHYVANAFWMYHESGDSRLYDILNPKIEFCTKFPRKDFGKPKSIVKRAM